MLSLAPNTTTVKKIGQYVYPEFAISHQTTLNDSLHLNDWIMLEIMLKTLWDSPLTETKTVIPLNHFIYVRTKEIIHLTINLVSKKEAYDGKFENYSSTSLSPHYKVTVNLTK